MILVLLIHNLVIFLLNIILAKFKDFPCHKNAVNQRRKFVVIAGKSHTLSECVFVFVESVISRLLSWGEAEGYRQLLHE